MLLAEHEQPHEILGIFRTDLNISSSHKNFFCTWNMNFIYYTSCINNLLTKHMRDNDYYEFIKEV